MGFQYRTKTYALRMVQIPRLHDRPTWCGRRAHRSRNADPTVLRPSHGLLLLRPLSTNQHSTLLGVDARRLHPGRPQPMDSLFWRRVWRGGAPPVPALQHNIFLPQQHAVAPALSLGAQSLSVLRHARAFRTACHTSVRQARVPSLDGAVAGAGPEQHAWRVACREPHLRDEYE